MSTGLTTIESLRRRVGDLKSKATAKLAELRDGIGANKACAIEAEHDALCQQLEATNGELRDAQHRTLREIGDRHGCRRLVDDLIGAAKPENEIRDRILQDLVAQQEKQGGPTGGSHNLGMDMTFHANHETFDDPSFRRHACEDAIYARLSGKAPENDAAKPLMGRTLLELDAISSGRRGYLDSGYAEMRGTMTTSDLPNLTLGAGQRFLQERYQQSISPVFSIAGKCRRTTSGKSKC